MIVLGVIWAIVSLLYLALQKIVTIIVCISFASSQPILE